MGIVQTFRGLLSVFLTGVLLLSCCPVGAGAMETEETTFPTETAETTPAETEQTLPPETYPEETPPPETIPEETAPETTVPEEAQPSSPVPLSVRYAKTLPAGTDGITLLGTISFHDYGLTVLQDVTGGIVLTLPAEVSPAPGLAVQVTGMRGSGGLDVTAWKVLGTEPLPEEEAALSQLPEGKRVVIRGASFCAGFLIQQGAQTAMVPEQPEGIRDGETVDVWGVAANGRFYADTIRSLSAAAPSQTGTITAMPSDGLLYPGEQITLSCALAGGSIYYTYSYDGTFFSDEYRYSGGITVDSGEGSLYLRAYTLSADGVRGNQTEFYFTRPATAAAENRQQPVQSSAPEKESWNFYFGQLHAHSDLSDGAGTVEEAFQYASQVPGLDFFAVTDHSDSFDNASLGGIQTDGMDISQKWARGKAAAAAVTGWDFVGIFGYEMSWPERVQQGHINTFRTKGWEAWNQYDYPFLENYYKVLADTPGSISQFNHPGSDFGDFGGFGNFNPRYVESLQLLEVGGSGEADPFQYYAMALSKGWRVAPTSNQNNHYGQWGDKNDSRTVVLAKSLSENAIYDAMADRRVYATEDKDLEILYTVNGAIMGSVLTAPAQSASVTVWDATDPIIGRVELIGDGNVLRTEEQVTSGEALSLPIDRDCSYYYLRITQPDGDRAVTAPVWVDLTDDVGIKKLSADITEPMEGQEILLTLEFYNNELQPLELDRVEFFANGQSIHTDSDPDTAESLSSSFCSFRYTHEGYGAVTVEAVVTATVAGASKEFRTETALYYEPKHLDGVPASIAEARQGEQEELYRVTGWVTAGNSNPDTTLQDLIFLQDDTGGIAVTGYAGTVAVGRPLEIIGYLQEQDGNPVLKLRHQRILEEEDDYRYVPGNQPNSTATDYAANGGELVQVSGQVWKLQRTEDGQGISWFLIRDTQGGEARVQIDPEIRSSTFGVNQLATQVLNGRWVRAMGILWKEADGTVIVRVRNCDEVVYVSPTTASTLSRPDPSNPKTGTREYRAPFGEGIPTSVLVGVLCITAAGLAALFRLKRKRK